MDVLDNGARQTASRLDKSPKQRIGDVMRGRVGCGDNTGREDDASAILAGSPINLGSDLIRRQILSP